MTINNDNFTAQIEALCYEIKQAAPSESLMDEYGGSLVRITDALQSIGSSLEHIGSVLEELAGYKDA